MIVRGFDFIRPYQVCRHRATLALWRAEKPVAPDPGRGGEPVTFASRHRRIWIVLALLLPFIGVGSPTFAQEQFQAPEVAGTRVDWCLTWGADCGKPAADRFCQDHGFAEAARFEVAPGVGPTHILGSGESCDDPRCDGFRFIECAAQPPAQAAEGDARIVRPSPEALRGVRTGDRPRTEGALTLIGMITYLPPGAELGYWLGDIHTSMDFAVKGATLQFTFNVARIPNARGVVWQVNKSPFPPFLAGDPSVLDPPGLVSSGRVTQVEGGFSVAFGSLPKPSLRLKTPGPIPWYVRVLPVAEGEPARVVGQPSNLVRVYDQELPPSDPVHLNIQQFTEKGAPIRLTGIEFVPYREDDKWPAGCETFKGGSYQADPFEWMAGGFVDMFDWASGAYADLKGYVIDGVLTFLPFVPREAVAIALDAALMAAGIPPSLPNLDQLMTQGADYLASQMADELAAQVPAGSLLAEKGEAELRRLVQEEAKKALVQNAKKAREALAASTKYCTTMAYDPFFKVTLRNEGSAPVENVYVSVRPSEPLFRVSCCGFTIDRIEAGESLTIPVEFLSKWDKWNLPQDPKEQIDQKTLSNWWLLYHQTPMSWRFNCCKTVQYSAMVEGGPPIYPPITINDGMGFAYESPARVWLKEAWVGP